MDPSELVEAGLYDPAAPDAPQRLALLEYLVELGATREQIVGAECDGRLPSLAADLVLFPHRTLTAKQAADRLGWSVEKLGRVQLAMGLPMGDDQMVADVMVRALEIFAVAATFFGEEALLQFSRVLGASTARVAESALSLFLSEVERPMTVETTEDLLRLTRANGGASEALGLVPDVIAALLPEHMEQALRHQRADTGSGLGDVDSRFLTVGFVDLVDFTARSQRLDPIELVDALGRFETMAWDAVVTNDGRVVKMIGDEVLFVTSDAAAACRAAVEICKLVGDDPTLVAARAGLASGTVSTWGADVFGPVVNLASRVTKEVPAGHVAAAPSARDAIEASDPGWRFDSIGERELKGFDETVELFDVSASS